MNSSVCGVLVSYHPSVDVLRNARLLLRQVDYLVVVDNTQGVSGPGILCDLESLETCTVIRNKQNVGIAAALNIGIGYAISRGISWIIMFDQDSQVGDGYVEAMLSTWYGAAKRCQAGIVCPRYRDARLGCFLPTHRSASGDVVACMTSGSMIRAETFQSYGPMDERLFIDYVDLDYCLRLRAAGLKIIESDKAILVHSLGSITQHQLLWKTFSTTNHSAKRRYYITRNRLVLIVRYFIRDREWALADLKGMVLEAGKSLLVETDRLAKVGYMLRAVFDAMFNRLGPRVPL